ncbi:N-acetylaspartate synthetase isoform X2 [Choloepus didactylus]|uniref:N-acetylaspartate synthetase isoform X2 n=1 Tax=Choloepus didactylus TaxID=27675 RepID=UPI00189FF83E|nr:N-acetylaspartate synthetase isoform X2 [Choloepus didactylus]
MRCRPPDMVCETKIVAADDHETLPGAPKDARLGPAAAMWPPLPAAPGPAAPGAPPPAAQPRGSPDGAGAAGGSGLCIREFRAAEQEAARRIFYDGIMERIPNTAFRGLRQHPRTQLLYALLAALCFAATRSLLLTSLVPAALLGLRYYYSRKVVLAYLDCALHSDMADIERYYMKPPGPLPPLPPAAARGVTACPSPPARPAPPASDTHLGASCWVLPFSTSLGSGWLLGVAARVRLLGGRWRPRLPPPLPEECPQGPPRLPAQPARPARGAPSTGRRWEMLLQGRAC